MKTTTELLTRIALKTENYRLFEEDGNSRNMFYSDLRMVFSYEEFEEARNVWKRVESEFPFTVGSIEFSDCNEQEFNRIKIENGWILKVNKSYPLCCDWLLLAKPQNMVEWAKCIEKYRLLDYLPFQEVLESEDFRVRFEIETGMSIEQYDCSFSRAVWESLLYFGDCAQCLYFQIEDTKEMYNRTFNI